MLDRFMPHGMCFAWQHDVLTLHVVSDALIALAYFSIPALMFAFVRRRRDLPFQQVFWLFGLFIVACGTTHLLAIWVIWHPDYWLDGAVKALTAAASVVTAIVLVPIVPKALALRSPRELERVNGELAAALRDLAREHHIASTFQTASLVPDVPHVPGLRFSAVYDPAGSDLEVGGDWYDAFLLGDGRVAITVGDVAGKGLEAAIIMAKVRQSLRAAAAIQIDPGAILDAADRALRTEYPDRFVTAFVGLIDTIEATLTYANAGHPWPLLRRNGGAIAELRSISLPLGLRVRGAPKAETAVLAEGDTLVAYTDGLTEATRDPAAGERRLWAAVAALEPGDPDPARTIRSAVIAGAARDDVAVLVMTYAASDVGARVERWTFASDDAPGAERVRTALAASLSDGGASDDEVIGAELVFSELVGNVYRYAPGAVEVVLDGGLAHPVLHVLDRGEGFVHAAKLPNDLLSERGRGLYLVATLTEDFSIMHRSGGGSHARAVLSTRTRAAVGAGASRA